MENHDGQHSNIKLDVPESEQGPGQGGAMLAMVACGLYPSVADACEKLARTAGTVVPDPEIAARYEERYRQYRQLYPALKGVFADWQLTIGSDKH